MASMGPSRGLDVKQIFAYVRERIDRFPWPSSPISSNCFLFGGALLATRRPSPALAPRSQPTQQRGRETYERLLNATAAVLESDGFEALTTNAIAARAGVNVASLYKYFPNKFAMLRALAERNIARQRAALGGVLARAAETGDWRRGIEGAVDAFVETIVAEPGFAAVSDALRVTPALREMETAGMPAMIELVAAAIRAQDRPAVKREARTIARVVVEAGAAILMPLAQEKPAVRKRVVREAKRMLVGYLEPVFDT